MLDRDNSAFLCIRSLRGFIHSVAQFPRKDRFSIDIGSFLKMDGGGQNLHVHDLFPH